MNSTQNDELVCQICSVLPYVGTELVGGVETRICNDPHCLRQCDRSKVTVVTHNGQFHADDVIAVTVASSVLTYQGRTVKILRTRAVEIIAAADVVIDVGGQHDPARGRFDHHQKGGAGSYRGGIPYASVGLVWAHYGRKYIQAYKGELMEPLDLEDVWMGVQTSLITCIDASDNGSLNIIAHLRGDPTIGVQVLTPSNQISRFNDPAGAGEKQEAAFATALAWAKTLLNGEIDHHYRVVQDRTELRRLWEGLSEASAVLSLPRYYAGADLFCREVAPELQWLVYPNEDNTMWILRAVPTAIGEEANLMPPEWAGLADEALAKVSGVADSRFCHNKRFIGGCDTQKGALQMAKNVVLQAGLASLP